MQVAKTIEELRIARRKLGEGSPLALVPTMGALHAGHLSLIELVRRHVGPRGHIAASVFVNPAQFNDPADLAAYPQPLDDDLAKLRTAGVDLAFTPSPAEMYPPGELDVAVDVPALTGVLEGAHRPGHFAGVGRVVLKLFHLFEPDAAAFGMKDFQQLRLIEVMTAGLNLPIQILRGPTQRDADGLAMSSRNARLSPAARKQSLAIPHALDAGADASNPEPAMTRILEEAGLRVDYAACVDPATLQPTAAPRRLLAIAATVDGVRLIDNRLVE